MGEMGNVYGTLAHNLLFRGGDAGNDSAIVLHSYGKECAAEDGSGSTQIHCGDMIGTSGVFEGEKFPSEDVLFMYLTVWMACVQTCIFHC